MSCLTCHFLFYFEIALEVPDYLKLVILLPQPPQMLGLQVCTTVPR